MTALETTSIIGVIGAGTMGAGIAQVAAAAGHPVILYDAFDGAAATGKARLAEGLEKLVARGRMSATDKAALLDRIEIADSLDAFSGAALVIEAVVERLDVKRELFAGLEAVIAADAILATNTSSISVTSIARDARHPERVVGMHFFNPAPIMKLVEVVSGVATSAEVARTILDTAQSWGKVPVPAKSTPGFIVNRVARPYYAEALRLCEEQLADPATLDALMTEGAGFRMGPFDLMDLIGHDVNYAVSQSVFDAFYQDPRFRPSIAQLELVNAGRLGRKSGHGFYDHASGATRPEPSTEAVPSAAPFDLQPGIGTRVDGVDVVLTDGRRANDLARLSGAPVIVYDLGAATGATRRLAFAASREVPEEVIARFVATLDAQGIAATRLRDWPGLVAMRTAAMLANEGFEAVLQGVADEAGVDAAMRYGVNYPEGPMAWARRIGLARIVSVLDALHGLTGDPRYRASMGLRLALDD